MTAGQGTIREKTQEWVDKRFGVPNTFNTQLLYDYLEWFLGELPPAFDSDNHVLTANEYKRRLISYIQTGTLTRRDDE